VVWLARYKAWGRIHKLDVNDIAQPFRFAGQYEDAETGLFYNRFRYYDPDSARFLTQDPIRLAGGNNLYSYTPNPVAWIDPLGLAPSPATGINSLGQWIDAQGNLAATPNVATLPELRGKSIPEVRKILKKENYVHRNPSNPRNERWVHSDGSEVQIHKYGNVNTTPYKCGNNAHAHKSLGKHGESGTIELSDTGTPVHPHSAEAHIGLKNPKDFPTISGRPHGS